MGKSDDAMKATRAALAINFDEVCICVVWACVRVHLCMCVKSVIASFQSCPSIISELICVRVERMAWALILFPQKWGANETQYTSVI